MLQLYYQKLSNLTLLRKGLPPSLALLHAQTSQSFQYNIKHKLGIGDNSHSHNNPLPVYGVGQGSTNVPARWGFICDHLINLYKKFASDAIITSQLSDNQINNKIAGIVNNTALLMLKPNANPYTVIKLEINAQMKEVFLYTTGGKLKIPKCNFIIIQWIEEASGTLWLDTTTKYNLHIKNSETFAITKIPQILFNLPLTEI
jgi:hypothetical protein